jgi:hypothetical protein
MQNATPPGDPRTPLQAPQPIPPPPSLTTAYVLVGVVGLFMIFASVVGVEVLRPGTDNAALDAIIFTALASGVGFVLNFLKSSQAVAAVAPVRDELGGIHKSINSGFENFERTIKEAAFEAGKKAALQEIEDTRIDEARVAGLVAEKVAAFLAAQQAVPRETPEAAPVDVEHIHADAAKSIADAVTAPAVAGTLAAIADALPASDDVDAVDVRAAQRKLTPEAKP